MVFNALQTAKPDAIRGLSETFNKDTNPKKINLGVGLSNASDNTTPTIS